MMKILIIQTAFIGDVILSTPIIETIIKNYPGAKIDFLLRKGNEALLKEHPYINKLIVWDKKRKYKSALNVTREVREQKYDHVINLQRFFTTGLISLLARSKNKTGYKKNPFSFFFHTKKKHVMKLGVHEVDRNLSLVEDFIDNLQRKPVLYPNDDDFARVKQYKSSSYVCICPTSVWYTKQLPHEKWVSLMKRIPEDTKIYMLGSLDDQDVCQSIQDKTNRDGIKNLAGKLSLLQSAALMKDAKMNYVNDSAPLHIASAMNAPVTAIFCSTIPDFGFGPLSDQSKIVETEMNLDCRPCGLHGYKACPEEHFNCANSIMVKQIINNNE